ncbi:hypothetical protein N7450_005380 [Penicillium hetheringtonii]|uniref:Uncharacterized protein n=1 Tax=Penicillium hetheringtonii TaxID=911720 RepID=A0AAD6DRS4_9EURO|nr:hypothetical protein N7450_005380 [Penicillium hetheringtonii]
MRLSRPGLFCICFLNLVADVASIVPPSKDSWYFQPNDIGRYVNGEVIRSRHVTPQLESFTSLPVNVSVKSITQYLFRTTDNLGHAVASAATLIEPFNADSTKLLGYQTFYDSASVDCSPSYTIRAKNEGGESAISKLNVSLDIAFMASALNLGWYVLTTDYEGLDAQYTVGLQSGHAVLDSLRAVLRKGTEVGLSKNPQYALWGYSGGALACSWAAELQPTYAPELSFVGVALGGLTPNVTSVLDTIHKGIYASLAYRGLYGMAKAYPNLTDWMNDNLLPSKSDEFYEIAGNCNGKTTMEDLYSFFKDKETSFEQVVPRSVFAWSGQMGVHGIPTAPLFIYKAVDDEISPIADTDYLIKMYCSNGVDIEYHRNLIGNHETEGIIGSVGALEWLRERLNGSTVQRGCRKEDVVLASIGKGAVPILGDVIFSILQSSIGAMV